MPNPKQLLAVNQIAKAAVACERTTGIPAELTTAQCIYESAFLTISPSNNCFGIKVDGHGNGVHYSLTHEYLNGQWKEMPLAFESYATLADCFADHARLIQSGRYLPAWQQFQKDHDFRKWVLAIGPIYGTDPMYAQKMLDEANSDTVTHALGIMRGLSS